MAKTTTGPDGGKQKLSPQARRDKQARDKADAMTADRKKKKRDNQTFVDSDGNKGQRSDSDIHHTKSGTQRRTSIAYNRATHTRGEVKT
jgi:hypothetical protein|tara:strand:- start:60 stop:326 length:267 start_codon:yes stop_codon:yes gene_type:complete